MSDEASGQLKQNRRVDGDTYAETYCFDRSRTYLVKVLTTPVGGSLSCVSVKDGKEAMAGDALVVVDKGVRILQWV
jgi:acetyl/propionyl-CoA carboxylase alpha subunit